MSGLLVTTWSGVRVPPGEPTSNSVSHGSRSLGVRGGVPKLKKTTFVGGGVMATKKIIGNPTPRVEGEAKVTGKAKYAVDVTLPGMLWGKCLRSPIPSGRVKRIDASRALLLPGVKTVVTGEDVAGLRIGRRVCDMPILADGVVRFIGEKVAAGAAETEEIAEQALDLIEVEDEGIG